LEKFNSLELSIKAKWVEVAKSIESNPNLKKELETEMRITFELSDADKDGLLNIDEYKAFVD